MKIPVYYPLEDTGDDYVAQVCCSHCRAIIYDDRLGWTDDPEESGVIEHRHKVDECVACPILVDVQTPEPDIDLDEIPF